MEDDELWEYVRIPKEKTGLRYDIFADDNGAYKTYNHELWLYVELDGVMVPIIIKEQTPSNRNKTVNGHDLTLVYEFIQCNYQPLKNLADLKINHTIFWHLITEVCEASISDSSLRVEDHFDVCSLSRNSLMHMTTDMTVFLQGQGLGSNLTEEGEILIRELPSSVWPTDKVLDELKRYGFEKYQFKCETTGDDVRIILLYVDIARNTKVLKNIMYLLGWNKVQTSPTTIIEHYKVRVMSFEPITIIE